MAIALHDCLGAIAEMLEIGDAYAVDPGRQTPRPEAPDEARDINQEGARARFRRPKRRAALRRDHAQAVMSESDKRLVVAQPLECQFPKGLRCGGNKATLIVIDPIRRAVEARYETTGFHQT